MHHKDQSGGETTDFVGFKECISGHEVCGHHKAGRLNSITAITIAVTEGSWEQEHTSMLKCVEMELIYLKPISGSFHCNFEAPPHPHPNFSEIEEGSMYHYMIPMRIPLNRCTLDALCNHC